MTRAAIALVLIVGCGSGRPGPQYRLAFATADANGGAPAGTVTMNAGEIRTIELLIVGSADGDVKFSAENAPSFVTLSGALLTIAPQRSDAGSHLFTLRASDGKTEVSQSMQVVVNRANQPPQLMDPYPIVIRDDLGARVFSCPSQYCTLFGNVSFRFVGQDPDGDDVTIEVEVLPSSQPFTGHANASATVTSAQFVGSYVDSPNYVKLPLPLLEPGVSYHFAVRLTDQFGATNKQFTQLGDGWETVPGGWMFDEGPCTDRTCACVPTDLLLPGQGGDCSFDQDCCGGGHCLGSPGACRPNQAPQLLLAGPLFVFDDLGGRYFSCPSQYCTLFGNVNLSFVGRDPDGDDVTIEVEVLPSSQPFTGHANASATLTSAQFVDTYNDSSKLVKLPLPPLVSGVSYHFAVRVTDKGGATDQQFTQLGNGWETWARWIFDEGPCTDRTCACVPTDLMQPGQGGDCTFDQDCCGGGHCLGNPGVCQP